MTEARFEYGEMNITKLNQRIDDIEDEIFREKMKVKKCSDELNDTFDDMIANYWSKFVLTTSTIGNSSDNPRMSKYKDGTINLLYLIITYLALRLMCII